MYTIENTTPKAYSEIIRLLETETVDESRLSEMREHQTVIVRSDNPRERWFHRPNVNWAFGLQEAWAYWTGKNPGHVQRYNSNMERYIQDDGEMLGSAYGRYMRHLPHDQIGRVIDQLTDSPETRRAVINIHNAEYEDYGSNDVACTVYLQFLLRDEQLNCISCLRSQDMLWGYPYDTQAFQWIQEAIAGILGVEVGWYEHRMNSCHYYTDFEEDLIESKDPDVFELPDCRLNWTNVRDVELSMDQGLRRARDGAIPMEEMQYLDTISVFYSDWLRMMTAYEQSRFHNNTVEAERLADTISMSGPRDWITSYVQS